MGLDGKFKVDLNRIGQISAARCGVQNEAISVLSLASVGRVFKRDIYHIEGRKEIR